MTNNLIYSFVIVLSLIAHSLSGMDATHILNTTEGQLSLVKSEKPILIPIFEAKQDTPVCTIKEFIFNPNNFDLQTQDKFIQIVAQRLAITLKRLCTQSQYTSEEKRDLIDTILNPDFILREFLLYVFVTNDNRAQYFITGFYPQTLDCILFTSVLAILSDRYNTRGICSTIYSARNYISSDSIVPPSFIEQESTENAVCKKHKYLLSLHDFYEFLQTYSDIAQWQFMSHEVSLDKLTTEEQNKFKQYVSYISEYQPHITQNARLLLLMAQSCNSPNMYIIFHVNNIILETIFYEHSSQSKGNLVFALQDDTIEEVTRVEHRS